MKNENKRVAGDLAFCHWLARTIAPGVARTTSLGLLMRACWRGELALARDHAEELQTARNALNLIAARAGRLAHVRSQLGRQRELVRSLAALAEPILAARRSEAARKANATRKNNASKN